MLDIIIFIVLWANFGFIQAILIYSVVAITLAILNQ